MNFSHVENFLFKKIWKGCIILGKFDFKEHFDGY